MCIYSDYLFFVIRASYSDQRVGINFYMCLHMIKYFHQCNHETQVLVICLHIRGVCEQGGRSQNVTATFCDFPSAELSSVCSSGLLVGGKNPNLCLRLGGRDG